MFRQDILDFIKEGSHGSFVLATRKIPSRIRDRLLAIKSIFSHGMPLSEAFYFAFLPTRIRPAEQRKKILDDFFVFSKRETKRALASVMGEDGSLMLLGNPFFVSLDCYEELLVLLEEIFLDDQYGTKQFLREDSVVIDAGANMGVFSVLAASLAPKGKIYAFEPVPTTFPTLAKNVKPYGNVECFPWGLGEKRREETMVVSQNSTMGNFFADRGILSPVEGKY